MSYIRGFTVGIRNGSSKFRRNDVIHLWSVSRNDISFMFSAKLVSSRALQFWQAFCKALENIKFRRLDSYFFPDIEFGLSFFGALRLLCRWVWVSLPTLPTSLKSDPPWVTCRAVLVFLMANMHKRVWVAWSEIEKCWFIIQNSQTPISNPVGHQPCLFEAICRL